MTPAECIAAIEKRLTRCSTTLEGDLVVDLRYLLTRLKRAEELLTEWNKVDSPDSVSALERMTDMHLAGEDES